MPLVRVLFEPVRSAEPPIVSGTCALIDFERHLGRLARRDRRRLLGQRLAIGRQAPATAPRSIAPD